ncbi:glycoside hydrolase family 16 protein [Haloferula sp.]|uniref:glycoside hydrolase family 16 protein n=1 Tax=Haloferula sp. TaxID=2497595 RepID=UPI00329B6EE1
MKTQSFVSLLSALIIIPASAQIDIIHDIDPDSDPKTQPFESTPVEGYRLVWSDEFNGTEIIGNKWYYRTDAKLWSAQLPANNTVSDGYYRIAGKKQKSQGKDYTGGGMITKKMFLYGYYETRMKVPSGAGWHTSFWMMRDNELRDIPLDGTHIELDVIENDSSDPYHYQTDAHRWRPGTHQKIGTRQITTKKPLDQFHVYGLEFTPQKLTYFFDGKIVSETDATVFPHNSVNIWLTCLAAKLGKKTTKVDEAALPVEAAYDYVRFFQRDYATVEIVTPAMREISHPDPDTPLELEAKIVDPTRQDLKPTVFWSRHWGPGHPTFEDPTSLKTTATFPRSGTFDINCTITVGSATISDRIRVVVGGTGNH